MNDLNLCLEVVYQCHVNHYVTLVVEYLGNQPLEIEAWFQRTTNRKWPMGYQMVARDR